MRIAIVVPNLNTINGGRERVAQFLASSLHAAGHYALVLAREGKGKGIFYPHCDIPVLTYSALQEHTKVKEFRKLLISNGIEVCLLLCSHVELVPWALAVEGTSIALCIAERNDPWAIECHTLNRADRIAYLAMADRIVLQLQLYQRSLPTTLWKRTHIIPNAFLPQKIATQLEGAQEDYSNNGLFLTDSFLSRRQSVVIASRLFDFQKQISLCIQAFSLLPESCSRWTLDIYGEGLDKEMLLALSDRLGIPDRVFFHGFTLDIVERMAQSQIFAIPSAFEGFPNALLDAMQAGLPTVAFRGCTALRELVSKGDMGLLADTMTAESFATELTRLMLDDALRMRMAENACHHVLEYRPEKIITTWIKVLQECVNEQQKHNKNMNKRDRDRMHDVLAENYNVKKERLAQIVSNIRSEHSEAE